MNSAAWGKLAERVLAALSGRDYPSAVLALSAAAAAPVPEAARV